MKKANITLTIDTTDSAQTIVQIKRKGKLLSEVVEKTDQRTKSQNALPLIEKLLKQQKLQLADLSAIDVNPGPGSFTGVRVGVSIANALGWILSIPVNGKKVEVPKYAESKFA